MFLPLWGPAARWADILTPSLRPSRAPHPGPGTQVLRDPLRSSCEPLSPVLLGARPPGSSSAQQGVGALAHLVRRMAAPRALLAHGPIRIHGEPSRLLQGACPLPQSKLAEGGFPRGSPRPQASSGTLGGFLLCPSACSTQAPAPAWSSLLTSQPPHTQAPALREAQEAQAGGAAPVGAGAAWSTFARVTLLIPPKDCPAQCVLLFPSLYRRRN